MKGTRIVLALVLAAVVGCGGDDAVAPPVITLSIAPTQGNVLVEDSLQLTAAISGVSNDAVQWSVKEGGDYGVISEQGVFTAPGFVPDPPVVTIVASSAADSTVQATAQLTVVSKGADHDGLALVPAGPFMMGDGFGWCSESEREVTLTRAFRLGQYEVTNQLYMEALRWAYRYGHVTATADAVLDNLDGSQIELLDLDDPDCEIRFEDGAFSLKDEVLGDRPVVEVTWYGAAAYCDWLSMREGMPRAYDHESWLCNGGDPYGAGGYRLPTGAEWEYAAQFGDDRIYPWGNAAPSCERANLSGCLYRTASVGSYPPEKELGGVPMHDMAGNVWEWCNDWHQCDLGTEPEEDPVGPASSRDRVFRGGSWDYFLMDLRCSSRAHGSPEFGALNVGFRVARTAS